MSECIHCGAADDAKNGIFVGAENEINESVCNVCRAAQLIEETALSKREAQVAALKELTGLKHERIAEVLGLEKSTVDEYSRRAKQKIDEAERTVHELSTFR